MSATPVQLELRFPALPEVRAPWRSLVLIAAANEGLSFEDLMDVTSVTSVTSVTAPALPVTPEDPITDEDIPF